MDKAIARSRNVHGKSNQSNRRERLYVKRRRLHSRIVNVRNDNHHKATTAITKSAGRVVVETLNVAGMMRNRRLARAIVDAGMAGFLVKLEYKCAWYGADFEKADRWFPSSRLCADCGAQRGDDALGAAVVSWRMWRAGRARLQRRTEFGTMAGFELPGVPPQADGDRVSPATPAVVGEASTDTAPTCESPIARLGQIKQISAGLE